MSTTEHVFIIGRDFRTDQITAECSCGWESKSVFNSEGGAEEAWDDHTDVVFMEATERVHNAHSPAARLCCPAPHKHTRRGNERGLCDAISW